MKERVRDLLFTGLIIAMASGCSSGGGPSDSGAGDTPPAGEKPIAVTKPQVDPDSVLSQDEEAMVEAMNGFALDFFREVRGEEGNLFFSPFSIHQALSMTHAGAAGETAKEMAAVLGLDKVKSDPLPAAGLLFSKLAFPEGDRGYTLNVANALWGQDSHPFKEEYVRNARKYFGAPLESVDFAGEPVAACKKINDWVETNTRGKIKNLIQPASITKLTTLILTNAIHFKGDWTHPFKENRTREGEFHVAGTGKVRVPLMHQKEDFMVSSSK
jgi:serpin B